MEYIGIVIAVIIAATIIIYTKVKKRRDNPIKRFGISAINSHYGKR